MNDKIKDLALDCIVENIASDHWVFTDAEFEKFTKLLVQECAEVGKQATDRAVLVAVSTSGMPDYVKGKMLKHFGITS